jgi:hypothetical protein
MQKSSLESASTRRNILPVDLEEIEGEEGTVFEGCEYFNSVSETVSLDVVYCELK